MRPRVRDLVDDFAEARLPELEEDQLERPVSREHGGACGRRERLRWLLAEEENGTKCDIP